jgi:hypothetical protein
MKVGADHSVFIPHPSSFRKGGSAMSIGIKLVQAVQKEAAMQRPLPLQATATEGNVTALVTLTDNDRLSHLASEFRVTAEKDAAGAASRRAASGGAGVRRKAEAFAARATYLTEPLRFVETDAGGTAVLRSRPETMSAPRAEYFEAQVTDATIALRRYQPHRDRPGRVESPYCVTDDVLARLADDAAAVLSPPSAKNKLPA